MNAKTDTKAEELEPAGAEKPVSVYSLNFSQILNDAEREFLMERTKPKKAAKPAAAAAHSSALSRAVFNWRSALAVGAILAVGVLHFVFQMAFIQSEKSELRRAIEPPAPAAAEPARRAEPDALAPPAKAPAEYENKKADAAAEPKSALPPGARRPAAAPAGEPLKKKESPAAQRARLRRAERLLTGV